MGAHRLGAEVVIRLAGKANMPFGLELGAEPARGAPSCLRRRPGRRSSLVCPCLGVSGRPSCTLIINSSWDSNYCYN